MRGRNGHYKTYDVENEQAMKNIDWDEAIDANNDVDIDWNDDIELI